MAPGGGAIGSAGGAYGFWAMAAAGYHRPVQRGQGAEPPEGRGRGETQAAAAQLDLNIDLGELPDEPEELYALATTVNLACGGHAGDRGSMTRAVTRALLARARIAAHPAYADRAGFGRARRFRSPREARAEIEAQCTRLHEIAVDLGASVARVKAHGGLYHDAADDADYAAALIDGAQAALPELEAIVGPPATALEDIVVSRGLRFLREGFADRRYDAHGKLVPRSEPGAVLADPESCVSQALMLARVGKLHTLCLHGDTPGALANARAVARALAAEGRVAPRA